MKNSLLIFGRTSIQVAMLVGINKHKVYLLVKFFDFKIDMRCISGNRSDIMDLNGSKRFYRLLFVVVVLLNVVVFVVGTEWDCASTTNSGSFTRATDCTISGDAKVSVNGVTFELVGDNKDINSLVKVTATLRNRITVPNYLKL